MKGISKIFVKDAVHGPDLLRQSVQKIILPRVKGLPLGQSSKSVRDVLRRERVDKSISEGNVKAFLAEPAIENDKMLLETARLVFNALFQEEELAKKIRSTENFGQAQDVLMYDGQEGINPTTAKSPQHSHCVMANLLEKAGNCSGNIQTVLADPAFAELPSNGLSLLGEIKMAIQEDLVDVDKASRLKGLVIKFLKLDPRYISKREKIYFLEMRSDIGEIPSFARSAINQMSLHASLKPFFRMQGSQHSSGGFKRGRHVYGRDRDWV